MSDCDWVLGVAGIAAAFALALTIAVASESCEAGRRASQRLDCIDSGGQWITGDVGGHTAHLCARGKK